MTFKQGTLVRVLPVEEMTDMPGEPDAMDIEQVVAELGYIYIVEKFVPSGTGGTRYTSDSYVCRSLATGKVQDLFVWEITDEGAN